MRIAQEAVLQKNILLPAHVLSTDIASLLTRLTSKYKFHSVSDSQSDFFCLGNNSPGKRSSRTHTTINKKPFIKG